MFPVGETERATLNLQNVMCCTVLNLEWTSEFVAAAQKCPQHSKDKLKCGTRTPHLPNTPPEMELLGSPPERVLVVERDEDFSQEVPRGVKG